MFFGTVDQVRNTCFIISGISYRRLRLRSGAIQFHRSRDEANCRFMIKKRM
jgi:hypothetical protein